jgi:hypothetical protein
MLKVIRLILTFLLYTFIHRNKDLNMTNITGTLLHYIGAYIYVFVYTGVLGDFTPMLFCDLHDVASKNEIFKQKGQTCMRQVCR